MKPRLSSTNQQLILVGAALVALTAFCDQFGISPVSLTLAIIIAAQPLMLAALGEMVVEKSGVLNLGVEGMMIIGAIAGFAISVETTSVTLGFVAAAAAGAALALIFGVITQILLANQVATGLALTLFGLGLAALIGQPYSGLKPPPVGHLNLPILSDMPVFGPILFSHDAMVYLSLALAVLIWAFLTTSRSGLALRAIGENHHAAHALGYHVVRTRLLAIAFGGACAGLGGAYLSLIRVPQWNEGMTAGAGWIALAIVVFGAWQTWRVVLGALLFGGVTQLQLYMQTENITPLWLLVFALFLFAVNATLNTISRRGSMDKSMVPLWVLTLVALMAAQTYPVHIPAQYISMAPYLATIVVLVVMSADKLRTHLNAPASLGQTFHRTD
ncbi:ABC transporter permease [Halovulum sp. GXIMD14793]